MKKLNYLLIFLLIFAACASNVHVVGDGPTTGLEESKRQYYALYGLIPIKGHVDTKAMAGNAAGYKIETKATFIDYLIQGLANSIIPTTITARTVTVTK